MITIDIFAVCAFVRGIRKEGPGYNCPGVLPFPFACIKYQISKVFSWKKVANSSISRGLAVFAAPVSFTITIFPVEKSGFQFPERNRKDLFRSIH